MSDRGKSRKPRSNPLSPSSPSNPSKALTLTLARMARRSLLKPTLFTALSLLALYSLFHASLSPSHRLPSVALSEQNHLLSSSSPPVTTKIYLYDLPSKFTYGVIRSYLLARSSSSAAAASYAAKEDTELRYPGHQHSAEWWLFSDLLRSDRPPGSPIVRVDDPAEADLFYVPFFSSLSLIVNPIRPPGVGEDAASSNSASYSDEGMQEELLVWLEGQEYWRRNGGRDHVFICQDPNALYKVVDRIRNSVLLVSDFGRLRPDQASLIKDVILPYSHRINRYNGEIGVEGRPSLLFFMGNRYRKEGGKVRDTLFKVLEKENNVIIKHGAQSRESRRMATRGMHSSKFCLHPAGDTPSACRLFDAIVSLCIPVIVSDFIELPFEDVIDYKKISIFVETNSAVQPGFLTSLLEKVSAEQILQYQQELKSVRKYFEYEDRNGAVSEIWHQVSSKLPLIKLMINRDKRLVRRDPDNLACSYICSRNNERAISR